jgi:hypothetical protein
MSGSSCAGAVQTFRGPAKIDAPRPANIRKLTIFFMISGKIA